MKTYIDLKKHDYNLKSKYDNKQRKYYSKISFKSLTKKHNSISIDRVIH